MELRTYGTTYRGAEHYCPQRVVCDALANLRDPVGQTTLKLIIGAQNRCNNKPFDKKDSALYKEAN